MNTTIPVEIATILLPFATIFTKPVWSHAQILLIGAILTTGKRTITSVLAVMGLSKEEHFQNYHRVLNRAVWSNLEASRVLLIMLVTMFVPSGPIILGIDDKIERLAHHLQAHYSWKTRQTIWYSKSWPTFSDALALIRRFFWAATFSTSSESTEIVKVPRTLFERLRDIAIYATYIG